jgi:NAD(P)-dependent dehydrogenase (short-subunit alcohol dehydrogenase family)
MCNRSRALPNGRVAFYRRPWDWILGVNLGGVINGVHTFLPRILAHGEGGHIVNTSSIGAIVPMAGGIAYITAKAAVVGLTEALRAELAGDPVGVTLLSPGPTVTNIHEVARLRPQQYQDTGFRDIEAELAQRTPPPAWRDPIAVGELVLEEIRKAGGKALALALAADVTDTRGVQGAVEAAVSSFGPISVLVNNAGTPGPYGPVDVIDPAQWWTAQTVNVLGPLLFMNAVIPAMRQRSCGRVINIVSNAGLQSVPHLSAYAVSKSTLIRLTETVDLELRASLDPDRRELLTSAGAGPTRMRRVLDDLMKAETDGVPGSAGRDGVSVRVGHQPGASERHAKPT